MKVKDVTFDLGKGIMEEDEMDHSQAAKDRINKMYEEYMPIVDSFVMGKHDGDFNALMVAINASIQYGMKLAHDNKDVKLKYLVKDMVDQMVERYEIIERKSSSENEM